MYLRTGTVLPYSSVHVASATDSKSVQQILLTKQNVNSCVFHSYFAPGTRDQVCYCLCTEYRTVRSTEYYSAQACDVFSQMLSREGVHVYVISLRYSTFRTVEHRWDLKLTVLEKKKKEIEKKNMVLVAYSYVHSSPLDMSRDAYSYIRTRC